MFTRIKSWFRKRILKKYDGYVPLYVIAKYLPSNPVIIEAGAFDGADTVAMAKYWPEATIHALEPVPNAYQKLFNAAKDYTNKIYTYPVALSNQTGIMQMHVSNGPFGEQSSSLLPPKEHLQEHPEIEFTGVIEVETITLDQFSEKYHVEKVDFLWLDMQGYELPVLKASLNLFNKVSVVYMEVSKVELYEGCALYPEVKKWMIGNGFVPAVEELYWKDGGNVLFVRK